MNKPFCAFTQRTTSADALRAGHTEAFMEEQPNVHSPRFVLGQVLATNGALTALAAADRIPEEFLARHQVGDWGDLTPEDVQENELALQQGYRLLSAYNLGNDMRIWLITEADRSATTLLLPDEY